MIARFSGRFAGALTALVVVAASVPALAAEETGRYSMTPADGGVIRLDRETGAMSFCTGKDGAWSCTPMADSAAKLDAELKRLEAENKSLKEKAETAPTSPPEAELDPSPPEGVPQGSIPVPTEKDVDRLFDYMEGMVKKFRERIDQLEKKTEPGTPL